MSRDAEKDSLSTEDERLLREDKADRPCFVEQQDVFRDLQSPGSVHRDACLGTASQTNPSFRSSRYPASSIVDVNGDDPPPYTAIAPPNHVGWSFDFSIPYSTHDAAPHRPEAPLAPFQGSLDANLHPDVSGGQHTSISLPLTPYRIFKFGSHRSLFVQGDVPFPDGATACKTDGRPSRKYGAILVAAAVIMFLMALSLVVRFIVERSFWRT
ncbi:hypothetical protein KM043_016766 [Ampulex compressa]|nr:hypothetical protein KM043_016766 [Ampulex compressa]